MEQNDSNYLFKGPCEICGSSDGRAIYDDGHSFCFACPNETDAYQPADDTVRKARPASDVSFLQGDPIALSKRGISLETCEKYRYLIGKMGGNPVQIAQYFDKGALVAQHVRHANKDFTWIGQGTKLLWGQQLWRQGGKRLVITEGEIDCLTIAQAFNNRWPVVSIPSGSKSAAKAIKAQLEWVCSFEEIVIAFDDDDPGREAVEDVVTLLPAGKAKIMSYKGHKDANDLLREEGPRVVGEEVFNAKPWRPDGVVPGSETLSIILERPDPGLDICYPKLSEKFYGFSKKRIYLFTAGSGIGKSTAIHEIAFDLAMRHQQTIGILALEDSLREAVMRHMAIHANIPLYKLDELSNEELTRLHHEILGTGRYHFYDHWGSSDVDVLMGKLRYMTVGLACDWLVLDHISIVVSGLDVGGDERKVIDVLMTKLRSLVEETGVGLLAIVHLKRPQGTGKTWSQGRIPSLTDLRGSASLEQLSDGVIGLWCNQEGDEPNVNHIVVLKNRKTGKKGEADTLEFSESTGRLLPVERGGDCGFNKHEGGFTSDF
jgi:twinkle protein